MPRRSRQSFMMSPMLVLGEHDLELADRLADLDHGAHVGQVGGVVDLDLLGSPPCRG
jgi:hypothetical protein